MATTAKKTVKKTTKTTVKPTSVEPTIEVTDASVEESKLVIEKAPEKKVFKPNDMIPCVSVTNGMLGMTGGQTKFPYVWADYGDVVEVEYQDLVYAVRFGLSYIFKPRFVIQDDDFINEFSGVKKLYDQRYSLTKLKNIFNLSVDEMKSIIMELPDNAKDTVKGLAATAVSSGTLDSVSKIRVIDEIFGTKLLEVTDLYNA